MRYALAMILFLFAHNLLAQNNAVSYPSDLVTYDLMMSQDWKQLHRKGEEFIRNGNDYPLMRIRTAYGYFMSGRYYQAIYHYRKALKELTDPTDSLLRSSVEEYLHYCYLYTGQQAQAVRYTRNLDQSTRERLGAQKLVYTNFTNMEYGQKFSTDESLYEPLYYMQAGHGFRYGHLLSFYGAISLTRQKTYFADMRQQQAYLGGTLSLKQDWLVSPAFHYLSYRSYDEYVPVNADNFMDQPLVASLAITKNIRNFSINGSFTYNTLGKLTQLQPQLGLTWYPYGNNRLSITPSLFFLNNENVTWKPLASVSANYWAFKKVSFSASYLWANNATNFTEQNGYLVSNSYDNTGFRISAGFEWNFIRTLSLYGLYLYETKTETYYKNNPALNRNYLYQYNSGVIGLKATF